MEDCTSSATAEYPRAETHQAIQNIWVKDFQVGSIAVIENMMLTGVYSSEMFKVSKQTLP